MNIYDLKYFTIFIKHFIDTLEIQVSSPALIRAALPLHTRTHPALGWAIWDKSCPVFHPSISPGLSRSVSSSWGTEALTWESSRLQGGGRGWESARGREVRRRLIEGNDSLMVCTALQITSGHVLGKYLTVLSLFRKKAKESAGKRRRRAGCLPAWHGWDAKIPAGRQREPRGANSSLTSNTSLPWNTAQGLGRQGKSINLSFTLLPYLSLYLLLFSQNRCWS